MESFDWDKIISEIEFKEIQKAIDTLEKSGMFTDEDGFASTIMFKQASTKLIDKLKNEGYNGGELISFGRFYPKYGQVLAIYDSDRFTSLKSATRFLDNYVRHKLKEYKEAIQ